MSWISAAAGRASRFISKNLGNIGKVAAIGGATLVAGPGAGAAVASVTSSPARAQEVIQPIITQARETAAVQVQQAGVEAANAAAQYVAPAGTRAVSPVLGITRQQLYIAAGVAAFVLLLLVAIRRR